VQRARPLGRGALRGLIADPQPLWQTALAAVLRRLGFGAIEICQSPAELDLLVTTTRPHLILVDPEGFPRVRERPPAAPTVVVVVTAGAVGDGRLCISKRLTMCEIELALGEVIAQLRWATLTERELEILGLVAEGLSNPQIARSLWLSDQTVKFHLARAYRKLGVADRAAAVTRARQLALLDEPTRPPTLPNDLLDQVRTVAAEAPSQPMSTAARVGPRR
jgi:DNA-binding CsgD family transcriptional regulator